MNLSKNESDEQDVDLDKDCWKIIDEYFGQTKNITLMNHQLESFNDFISIKIPDIVKQYNPINVYHEYSEQHNMYKKEIIIHFNDVYISKPTIHENNGSTKVMFPTEARLRNFTYASPIFVDIKITIINKMGENLHIIDKKEKELKKISIGKIPIMVQSSYCNLKDEKIDISIHSECKYDYGGYFIINGSEKVLICQERQAENKAYAFKNIKQNTKYSHIVEMKSVNSEKISPAKTINVKLTSKQGDTGRLIKASIPHIRQDIPLFILFRCIGIESDKEIIKYILLDDNIKNKSDYIDLLRPSIEEASNIQTQNLAQEYLLKYLNILGNPKEIKLDNDQKIKYLVDVLKSEMFPHVGKNFMKKGLSLGYMVKKLLDLYLDKIPQDDRDSYINKRIDTPGVLMANIFRQYFTKLIKDMRNCIMKELNSGPWKVTNKLEDLINITNIYKIIKSTTIDVGMKYSLATGNWGIKNISKKVGVAQVLSRLSYNSTLSHCRRINTPIEKTGKLVPPRKLHATSWGYICPSETPEGGAIGVVKNLSLMSDITIFTSTNSILSCLNNLDIFKVEDITIDDIFGKAKIFVNGEWVAVSDNIYEVYSELIDYRRQGVINPFCSICISYTNMELNIYSDGGRLIRPLLLVKDNNLLIKRCHINLIEQNKYKWNNLILGNLCNPDLEHDSLIEYIDPQESDNCLIAANAKNLKSNKLNHHIYHYTHCEIHQSLILGVLAASIPCSDRNQSPRNTYQSAMGKQAMGIYCTNFNSRMDTLAHILHYPMSPIVNTRNMKYLNSKYTPNGLMAIVAIATYSGYNQEDSIIMNKSAVERGLFQSTFYRSYKDEEKKNQINGVEEKFCKPNAYNTKGLKPGKYNNLDDNGFSIVNSYMDGGDIIIGKVVPAKDKKLNSNDIKKYRDNSTSLRSNESGRIDKVYQNRNGDGYRFCKIRVRSNRIPQIGDKFSSRHGQKGTVGMVYPQEDMPFSRDGIVPDLIINPHAIPSRMTIGQLIECIMGKACTQLGLNGDGTPFTGITVNSIGNILEDKCQMERSGNEILYSGLYGKQLDCKIFMGPTYYQRLKHMVDDKIHSRSTGPLVLLTRQPAEGRSRDGGLRFGEMERDCMIAHGASEFLKERLLDMSDHYKVYICKKTGMISAVNYEKNIFNSFNNNTTEFSEIRIPYAYKLLIQELETMSICSRLLTV